MKVKIKILENGKGLPVPKKATEHSACVDLYAAIPEDKPIEMYNDMRKLIPCGFSIEVPPGYEAQVRPRSGLALKHGISVLNTPGTIDSDYRGEVAVILYRTVAADGTLFTVNRGERIAQLTIKKVEDFEFEVVDELSDTSRGQGGFGSTGK